MGLKLEDITGIGKATADRMKSAGIDSVGKLASIKLESLLQINGIGKSTAEKYIEEAKNLLDSMKSKEKKDMLEEKQVSDKNIISSETQTQTSDKKIPLEKVKIPEKIEFPKEKPIPKERISSKLKPRNAKSKSYNVRSKPYRDQRHTKKRPKKGIPKQKKKAKPAIRTFFPGEKMQQIRFLHFKIKDLEAILKREDLIYDMDDLKRIIDYVKLLNVNYKTQSQIKIFRELEITPSFYDPLEKREINIWDITYECTRALWILATAYAQLSNKFEDENKLKKAVVAMVECSKAYKTAAYFSVACTRQEDIGESLSAANLEFNSEEARVLAQSLAAMREENKQNLFRASKMYAGLSILTQRLLYLKNHDKLKEHQLRAQYNYDMGKACHLNANALLRASITSKIQSKVKRLQEKANYYYCKAEEIWENMLDNSNNLSEKEREYLEFNLSIVNENIMESDVEILNYDDVKNIEEPEPFITVPENLSYFLPKSTKYLTNFPTKHLEFKRVKDYKSLKWETKVQLNKIEKLSNKKAGIGRTIKELKELYENNDIDINKFSELLEKYSIKLKMIDSSLNKLRSIYKEKHPQKKQVKDTVVSM